MPEWFRQNGPNGEPNGDTRYLIKERRTGTPIRTANQNGDTHYLIVKDPHASDGASHGCPGTPYPHQARACSVFRVPQIRMIPSSPRRRGPREAWIPAFAGMTTFPPSRFSCPSKPSRPSCSAFDHCAKLTPIRLQTKNSRPNGTMTLPVTPGAPSRAPPQSLCPDQRELSLSNRQRQSAQ